MYDIGSIVQPETLPEAITALSADPEAIAICGGSDVLVKIREGKLAGAHLVSIRAIPTLRGITLENNGTLHIRPATTFTEITTNPLVQRVVPALGEAVDQAGGPQLRNVATIGGNICNGATSADSPPCLLTLDAELEIQGPKGVRYVPLEDFYAGPGRVHLEQNELLIAIRIAKESYTGYHGHYIKYAQRNAMDIATLGCAIHVKLDSTGKMLEDVRLAFGVAAPTPIRCHAAEEAVRGMPVGADAADTLGAVALTEVKPRSSWRASESFRRQLVYELSGRALDAAVHRAQSKEAPA